MEKSNLTEGERITFKYTRPNKKIEDLLTIVYNEAKLNNSKLEPMLKEALTSLSKYPLPLARGADCAMLKGFNRKLCIYIDKYLDCSTNTIKSIVSDNHNEDCTDLLKRTDQSEPLETGKHKLNEDNQHSLNSSQASSQAGGVSDNSLSYKSTDSDKNKPKKKQSKPYKPAYESGTYAILKALFEHSIENPNNIGLPKEDLIERAQKYSKESFLRPKPNSFYTAWSNMPRLISKGLVNKARKKKPIFSLTDEGQKLASDLINEYKVIPTANDIIFDNVLSSATDTQTRTSLPKLNDSEKENILVIDMPAGSFEIILLIDKNETSGVTKKNDITVVQFNKYPHLKHEYRSLKVGDFTWIARHKTNKEQELVLPYIIERKRMDDLGASIKDGRFHEQKFRLRKCGLKNVIYLIENYGKNTHVGLPMPSLKQALANTRVQDGFKINITDSLNNTVRFLAIMSKRLTMKYMDCHLKGSESEPHGDQLMTFKFFNKSSSKSRALTVTETFIKLLLQLKGVSVEKALAITSVYETPFKLIQTYKTCTKKDGETLLANLKHGEHSRNVGPIVSKAIFHLFSSLEAH